MGRGVMSEQEVVDVVATSQAQAGRDRARDARLKAARERRLELDPDQVARERRIDEAAVDVEVAWEDRAAAEQAINDAEVAAAAAIERLLTEKLTVKEIVQLTGLDTATVRRLRHVDVDTERASAGDAGGAAGPASTQVA
jgi:hypothetical protein